MVFCASEDNRCDDDEPALRAVDDALGPFKPSHLLLDATPTSQSRILKMQHHCEAVRELVRHLRDDFDLPEHNEWRTTLLTCGLGPRTSCSTRTAVG